jgi:hypothetical protein
MNDTAITGIFTILSGLIAYITASTITSRRARVENQRQLRELGFRMALANFEFTAKKAQALANDKSIKVEIYALPIYVAEGIKMAEIVGNPRLNAYEIGQDLGKIKAFTKKVAETMENTH